MEQSRTLQNVRSDLVLSWEIKHVVSWVPRHVQDAQELGHLPSPGDAILSWRIDALAGLSP